jgi:two-component system chemotaxis response regulator CheY
MKQYLGQLDISRIFKAEGGEKGLEVVENEKINLIVSDWLMPNMDGLGFLQEIRRNEKSKDIPFLMVTLVDQKEQVVLAVKEGIDFK